MGELDAPSPEPATPATAAPLKGAVIIWILLFVTVAIWIPLVIANTRAVAPTLNHLCYVKTTVAGRTDSGGSRPPPSISPPSPSADLAMARIPCFRPVRSASEEAGATRSGGPTSLLSNVAASGLESMVAAWIWRCGRVGGMVAGAAS